MAASIEERLTILESELGLTSSLSSGFDEEQQTSLEISSRVQSLLKTTSTLLQNHTTQQHNSKHSTPTISLERSLSECKSLAQSLDSAGLILASTSSSNDLYTAAPLIYRKQEVLARSQELQNALEQLANIRDLLSFSNQDLMRDLQTRKSGEDVSLDHVANAPILASPSFTFASEDVNRNRLDDITTRVLSIHDKTNILAHKCDDLISVYYRLMSAVNEKMVLFRDSQESKE
jgi:hypothetical protein